MNRKSVCAMAPRNCDTCGYYVNTARSDCPKCSDGLSLPKRVRSKPRHYEDAHQVAFFRWCALAKTAYPDLEKFYHVPNGGARNKAEAGRLKAQGVRAGVLDLSLDVARGGYFGLRIELKATKTELGHKPPVSNEQRQRIHDLRADGYYADIAEGWEQARDTTLSYLQMPKTQLSTPRGSKSMNKHEAEIAREAGRSARRSGKSRSNNPFKAASTLEFEAKANAWNEGWDEADRERFAANAIVR